MFYDLLDHGLSADVIVEAAEAYDRIGNYKAEQAERENARIFKIEKCEDHVQQKVYVIEHRKHCDGVGRGAEHDKRDRDDNCGERDAENKIYLFALFIGICGVEAQKVEYLHAGEAYHTGQALLLGQRHKENIRTHRADKAELSKDKIVCYFPEEKAEYRARRNGDRGEKRTCTGHVIHKKRENYFE